MIKIETKIVNQDGLHMRPSMGIVTMAALYKSNITIGQGNMTANAKSIMEVVTLVAVCGTTLTIIADGIDEEEAIKEIKDFIDSGFEKVYEKC